MVASVYLVTHTASGRRYVGITRKGVLARWTGHCYTAGRAPKTYLHRAIAKYGRDAFTVTHYASAVSEAYASELERSVILQERPEYNQTGGGESTAGRRITKDVCARIAKANKGKKRTPQQNAANSARTKAKFDACPVYRAKVRAAAAKARAAMNEDNRIAGIRRAAAEGKMSRKLSAERKAQQIANMTTPEARAKMAAAKCKKVKCLELGTVFDSVSAASGVLGVALSSISKVCRGGRKRASGLTFIFV